MITGVGSSSLAVLFATVAYFSISKKGLKHSLSSLISKFKALKPVVSLTGFRFSNPLHYISVDSDQNEKEESEPTTDEKIAASEANSESVDYVSDTVDTRTGTSSFWSILKHVLKNSCTCCYRLLS